MKSYVDKRYHFYELFNEENGTLFRSNVDGSEEDPYMRSFPELIDIGIMGHCESAKDGVCCLAGVDCYQNALNLQKSNMSLNTYKSIIKQCEGKVFQVALGGAGDPNKHENFTEILQVTRNCGIVPNMTTSGHNISDLEIDLIREYCGAVAVSFYSRLVSGKETNLETISSINSFISSGCITNIHYVVSKDSIDEAIFRLENDIWPQNIYAIIFLLYKPVGLGKKEKLISPDSKLVHFLEVAIEKKHPYRIGFDTCFSPILFTRKESAIATNSIDACEAARFSMYIDSEMNAYPCSFDNQEGKYKESLKNKSLQEVWDGEKFNEFRRNTKPSCFSCTSNKWCFGGCKLKLGIDLCAH